MVQKVQKRHSWWRFLSTIAFIFLLTAPLLAACSSSPNQNNESGIQKIKHIIVIMQENRSFDSYFGTFPGADGIPMKQGIPAVCIRSSRRV